MTIHHYNILDEKQWCQHLLILVKRQYSKQNPDNCHVGNTHHENLKTYIRQQFSVHKLQPWAVQDVHSIASFSSLALARAELMSWQLPCSAVYKYYFYTELV
jgi:hypothetical protein